MALTWTLIATIAREADTSTTQEAGGAVSGNMVIMYMRRTASVELWRSDDRGVTWAFHAVTGAGQNINGPAPVFDSKYWIKDRSTNNLTHTPSANPGAGGFTNEATGAISPVGYPTATDQSPFLYLGDVGAGIPNALFRRTGVATFSQLDMPSGSVFTHLTQIPGTADLLLVESNTLYRVTPSGSPVTVVNTFLMSHATHDSAPMGPLGALSATEYYASAAGNNANPARIFRTTNGGTSWTETNPSTDFWSGAQFAGNLKNGHMSGFVSFGGSVYSFLTFKHTSVPDEDREHVRVAKFNGTGWDPESNDTNDGFRVVQTLRGVNASGDLDFYAVTTDVTGDTVRVYRTTITQLAAGIVTAKALAWDMRELPVQGSRWTYHTPFNVGVAVTTGGRGDTEKIHFLKNDTPRVVEFPSGTTDEGTAISWFWKSRAYAFGAMLWEKAIRQVAPILLGTTGTVVVDFFKNLAAAAVRSYSLTYSGGAHERQTTKRVHDDVQGQVIQVKLSGSAASFEAAGVEIEPLRKRRPR